MWKQAMRSYRPAAAAIVMTAIGALAGCASTVSKEINDQGQALEVIFPNPLTDATQPEGSYPASESLGKLRVGLSKTQVSQLLGAPHFKEGFGAREWDYLLHIPNTDAACQLKLIYDKQLRVGSMHTQPEGCTKAAVPQ